jgi:AraC-like DNA-binding protein
MRLFHTEITPMIEEFLHIDFRNQSFLSSPYHTCPTFHSHPELELVFVLEGFGKRIIGNKVEPFESGDMVFIGSNVPHVWLSDNSYYEENSNLHSRVIVTYFNPIIFQQFFDAVKEFNDIKKTMLQASKGMRILGETRNIIAKKLITLSSENGFEKINSFLQILNIISVSNDKYCILNNGVSKNDSFESDRLVDVIKFVQANLDEHITLRKVAEIACMTEQSFCRFFKSRLKMNFFQYLEVQRMKHACDLLIQSSDKPIADIAFECGYTSSSHFCKVFKDNYNQSPSQYRKGIDEVTK